MKVQICNLHRTVANELPWKSSALSRCFSSYLLFYVNIYTRFCIVRDYVLWEKWLIVLLKYYFQSHVQHSKMTILFLFQCISEISIFKWMFFA